MENDIRLQKEYDELEQKLSGVLETLESILCEKLDSFGIYYRIFSRIKKGESIRNKLASEKYIQDPNRKIRDLIGVRIVLYYEDDIPVCQKIFEEMLELDVPDWKETDNKENEFNAIKTNGVFRLPEFILHIVKPQLEGLRIKPAFEIQLRTMYFEGWHEVEHDLKYKNKEIWDNFPDESRRMNSVLATLEMCDKYMVTVFNDIGHDLYKNGNWGQMIHYRYRLRTLDGTLDPEIDKYITMDLAKKIFKWEKEEFIESALERGFTRLDANIIVYLVNEELKQRKSPLYKKEISDRFEDLYEEEKKRNKRVYEKNISMLREEKAFFSQVLIPCKQEDKKEKFDRILDMVYTDWLKESLGDFYPQEFEKKIHEFTIKEVSVHAKLKYDRKNYALRVKFSHMGMDEMGKVWTVTLRISDDEQGFMMRCANTFTKPAKEAQSVHPYSRPRIYANLARSMGVSDLKPLTEEILPVEEGKEKEFLEFLSSPQRKLPVILISCEKEDDKMKKNSLYGQLVDFIASPRNGRTNLVRKVLYVCHVYCLNAKQNTMLSERLSEVAGEYANGVRFFGCGFDMETKENYHGFTQKQIENMPKDLYALNNKKPYCYQSVSGPDATRHKLIEMVYSHILGNDFE